MGQVNERVHLQVLTTSHAIMPDDQRKSLTNIHSLSCTPAKVKLSEAGLQNISKRSVSGFKIKVLPQLAGPVFTTALLKCGFNGFTELMFTHVIVC